MPHRCEKCGSLIVPGEIYYSEKLGGFVHALHVKLGKLCQQCYNKSEQRESKPRADGYASKEGS